MARPAGHIESKPTWSTLTNQIWSTRTGHHRYCPNLETHWQRKKLLDTELTSSFWGWDSQLLRQWLISTTIKATCCQISLAPGKLCSNCSAAYRPSETWENILIFNLQPWGYSFSDEDSIPKPSKNSRGIASKNAENDQKAKETPQIVLNAPRHFVKNQIGLDIENQIYESLCMMVLNFLETDLKFSKPILDHLHLIIKSSASSP